MEDYKISEKFLDEIINKCSKSLVGITMKRFEIHDNKEEIKREIKELIYESYRNLKNLIKSFDTGIKFITKKPDKG